MAHASLADESDATDADPRTEELRQRALSDLGWVELCEKIAMGCATLPGERWVLGLRPLTTEQAARDRWAISEDVLELASLEVRLPRLRLPEVSQCVGRMVRGSQPTGVELHDVRLALRAAAELARFLTEYGKHAPLLAKHLALDPSLRLVQDDLEEALEEDGAISDRAAPELRTARRRLAQLRDQIRARLGELMSRYREALQDTFIAERDGRYVLPVRADAPFRVHGIVLGSSASGATLYVEPQEIAELGNRLKQAEAEVEKQEALVLARLGQLVATHADAVLCGSEACAEADGLRAIEAYARTARCKMLRWAEPGCLRLEGARHPLLALGGGRVVPNDLLARSGHGWVLSGPNAGGKTVALKCIGLAALAQASGLPVPVDGDSCCGFFQAVFTDIGDDQSLARSLSTFSGHIEAVRDIHERAAPGVLVLLDELAGGTDPEEGAALAVALLESLVQRQAAAIVTTHYERLKEAAAASEHLDNAAVGFDFERLEPTFRLELGRPGASSALTVAGRHGLPGFVISRASELLPEMSRRREGLLAELEGQKLELTRLLGEAELEKERQAALSRDMEREQVRQAQKQRAELAQAGQELTRTVREARAEVQRLLGSLSQTADKKDLRQVQRAIDTAAGLVAWGGEVQRQTDLPKLPQTAGFELKVGQRVRVQGVETVAEVIELPKQGQVRVLAGALKLTLPIDQVQPVGSTQKAEGRPTVVARGGGKKTLPAEPLAVEPRTKDVSLDLRGERVETALERLDEFIDHLLRRGESVGWVLHGHGTGALKSGVRQHLEQLPLVARSRAAERGEGGDAWTVFWLEG